MRKNGSKMLVASDRVATKKLIDQEKFKEQFPVENTEEMFFLALIKAVQNRDYEAFAALAGDVKISQHLDKVPEPFKERFGVYKSQIVYRKNATAVCKPVFSKESKKSTKKKELLPFNAKKMAECTLETQLKLYSTAAIAKYAKEIISAEVSYQSYKLIILTLLLVTIII